MSERALEEKSQETTTSEDTDSNYTDADSVLENIDTMEVSTMKTPPPLSFDGNIKENWKKWKQRFDLYMEATALDTKPETRRIAVFLHTIGEEALEKYNTFNLSADDKKKFDAVAAAFENYCTPKANETVERHVFFTPVQQSGENFTNYLTD